MDPYSAGPSLIWSNRPASAHDPPLTTILHFSAKESLRYGGLWSHRRTRDLASIDFAPQAGAHCARVMGVSFRPRCKKQSVPSADGRQLCQVTGHCSYLAVELRGLRKRKESLRLLLTSGSTSEPAGKFEPLG